VGRLIYSAIASVDGYVTDKAGRFDWATPDPIEHAFMNDLERQVGTHLYGRRMYEVMTFWESDFADQPPYIRDYAHIWQAADKIVYSKTLDAPTTAKTRIERRFDPEAVRQMKEQADRDLSIGGANIAAQAIAAGLVDELYLFLVPVVVGGGTRALPDDVRLELELVDERRFDSGMVYLHYNITHVEQEGR